ncbi:predicted protein [Naegleria gruberi]|uniref:Predicted protein n=1 Tax=Naegleria gruberi TaxID=5762 RepID=D2W523_NAEGR|nr:uncharacterized protein NAEGRDRAFT_76511 [Naegleria gruberi]EFC35827.1 predicted protein [Naegleria gruberi]|eukprot:XP_002668571.1 predicted protein [Naegleria gruberi strain NEG-M]
MPQDKSELDDQSSFVGGKVRTNQDSGVGFNTLTINASPPQQQASDSISNMKENLITEVKNNDELSAASTLAVPNIDCGSNTTKMPTTSTLVVDDIIKNRRNIDDKRSLENRGTRTASLSMPTTNYLFPSSKSNLIPILPKTKDQEKEKMQKNKLTFQNSRNSLFQNSNKTTYTKVEMNKQSNDKRGQTKIDHQPKNLESPSLASIVLTPNTPNSVSNVNIETDESEINPILESVPFFIFLKIGILKENSEPKYLEAYRALSQQNLFFMTSWFRFAYMQEKYLSNEKTHMIANISHEARNPLHGIIGASTILRHDMEKNSHSDKRKKRGRKNSILQSPSHSPMNAKNGFLHVSNDDGHYSSDCESSCGDSTAEQPYLELVNDIYNNANLLLHIFSTSLQMTSLEMGNIKLKNEPFNLLDTIESVISINITTDNVPTIEVVIPEPVPSKRILITDDNLINRKVMEKMVRLLGFTEVDCASNGLECFEMYKQKQYSIILLDLLMPVMCGKQSVKHIREFEESEGRKRTPVIAITANIWESVDTLSQLGFDSVIYKPILIEKLREEVERLTQESNS